MIKVENAVAVASAVVGKEEWAGIELLDCIYPYDLNAKYAVTKYPGILLLYSALKPLDVIMLLKRCYFSLIFKVVPIEKWVKSVLNEIIEACVNLGKGRLEGNVTFKVECSKRGTAFKSKSKVEREVAKQIVRNFNCEPSIKNPDYIVVVEIIDEYAGISIVHKSMIWRRKDYFHLPLH